MKISTGESEKAILTEVGRRIRQYRIAQNLTQGELAAKCGISSSTEVRIENGEDTKLSNIIKLLAGLNLLDNLDVVIPEPQPDFKTLFEQKTMRRRAKAKKIRNNKNWIWDEDK